MNRLLTDKEIKNVLLEAIRSAQDYGDDGIPLPERMIAEAQDVKSAALVRKETAQEIFDAFLVGEGSPQCRCGCWEAFKAKYLK